MYHIDDKTVYVCVSTCECLLAFTIIYVGLSLVSNVVSEEDFKEHPEIDSSSSQTWLGGAWLTVVTVCVL